MFSRVCALIVTLGVVSAAPSELRNILLLTVDDLRPQLGAYGLDMTATPNIDRLASDSVTFHRAYCQMAVCSPSRNSFMSGRRCDTTKVWNFVDDFREKGVGADWVAMPEYFKNHGYLTYASGKLYHPAKPAGDDFPRSWTEDEYNPWYWGNQLPIGDAGGCGNKAADVTLPLKERWGIIRVCHDNNDTAAMNDHDNKTCPQAEQQVEYDHRVATRTIESMERAKNLGKNFFVAAGFRRPHLDWRHPKRFWDQYDKVDIAVAKHLTIGTDVPIIAYERNAFNKNYTDSVTGKTYREGPESPFPVEMQQGLRRGYYASVSFLDFEVGRIVDALEKLDLASSTAILFHSDHGWKLGEHGDWSKCTNWELDARVPLIIRAPWIPSGKGKQSLAFAELVDLYPTAVDLSGLPPVPASEGLEGVSLVPALNLPHEEAPHNKTMAFSQYPRCPQFSMWVNPAAWECLYVPKQNFSYMGYSIRVPEARLTQWRKWKPICVADWSDEGLKDEELYDHTGDHGEGTDAFDNYEYVNLAADPTHKELKQRLAGFLRTQFERTTPQC